MKKLALRLSLFGAGLFLVAGIASAHGSNMQNTGSYSANSSRTHYASNNDASYMKYNNGTAKVSSGKAMMNYKAPQPKIIQTTRTKTVTVVKKQTIVTKKNISYDRYHGKYAVSNKKQTKSTSSNQRNVVIHTKNVRVVNNNHNQYTHWDYKLPNKSNKYFSDFHEYRPNTVRNNIFIVKHINSYNQLNYWKSWNNWNGWGNNVRQISWGWDPNMNSRHWQRDSFDANQWWQKLSGSDRGNIMRFCNWSSMNNDQRIQFMLFWQSLTPSQRSNLIEFWNSLSKSQQIALLNNFNGAYFGHMFSFDRHSSSYPSHYVKDWHNMFGTNQWANMRI